MSVEDKGDKRFFDGIDFSISVLEVLGHQEAADDLKKEAFAKAAQKLAEFSQKIGLDK